MRESRGAQAKGVGTMLDSADPPWWVLSGAVKWADVDDSLVLVALELEEDWKDKNGRTEKQEGAHTGLCRYPL